MRAQDDRIEGLCHQLTVAATEHAALQSDIDALRAQLAAVRWEIKEKMENNNGDIVERK